MKKKIAEPSINTQSEPLRMESFLGYDTVSQFESVYNAKYICDTTIKGTNGWINQPFALFYAEVAHPEGSNWFVAYFNDFSELMITNGISAVEPDNIIIGLKQSHSILYSVYRHDKVNGENGTFIDGGRDYTRINGSSIELKITPNGLFEVIEEHA